jgi:tetratricopeptide (TPR) repeat protein
VREYEKCKVIDLFSNNKYTDVIQLSKNLLKNETDINMRHFYNYIISKCYYKNNESQKALEYAEKALKYAVSNFQYKLTYWQCGVCFFKLNNKNESLVNYQMALTHCDKLDIDDSIKLSINIHKINKNIDALYGLIHYCNEENFDTDILDSIYVEIYNIYVENNQNLKAKQIYLLINNKNLLTKEIININKGGL